VKTIEQVEVAVSPHPTTLNRDRPGLSVIIPAYNEEKGIGPVLSQLAEVLAERDWLFELVVVDDGSQDGTAAQAGQYPGVIVLRHRANRGYGAALKTGLRHARYDLICITDADGTYPNHYIPQLLERLLHSQYDMAVGARIGAKVAIPWVRRPAKWMIGLLANFVAGEIIPDLNSGLRVFRREAALQLFSLLPDGFSFTTTITLAMLTNGYLIDYIPIDYLPRVGQSKIKPVQDTLNFIQLILRIALYFAPLKIFLPLSGLVTLAALSWGFFSWLVLGRLADVSTLVMVMAAVQVAVVGLLAELINRRLPGYKVEH
jgi:glycosyltransferase involved in cell wall biosynthesis